MAKVHRLMPDTTFAKAFVIGRVLGEGAMGTVYHATRVGDGKPVALKVLKPSMAEDDRATARFAREAIVGERIGNPHVVDVLDAGFDEETELHWLSMEYLDGKALPAFLSEDAPSDAVRRTLLKHLFDAMAAAHSAGVLHRDLKPENVVVTGTRAAPLLKVLDFGVAKTFRPHMAASATEGGLGTPLWAAPEQGKGGEHMRPTVDVWALGLLTFYILTGKFYWLHANSEKSSMLDLAQEMIQAPILPPSERAAEMGLTSWPSTLDSWFLRCVDRSADQRFVDAERARAELFPLIGLSAPRPSTLPTVATPTAAEAPARHGVVAWVVVVAIVVMGLGAMILL